MSRFNLRPMMVFLWLTTLPNDWSAWAYRVNDGAPSHHPLVVEGDTSNAGRIGLDLILPQILNLTAPGKPRGPRRSLPRSLLQSRQENAGCSQAGFIYVCPATEHEPCCDPAFPICCHDPSDTCCPAGTFCSGLSTCCRGGTIGCGDGCCVRGQTCGLVNDTPTCVYGTANPAPSSTAPISSETAGGQIASGPSAPSSAAPNNTPVIAGAAGGGVVAIALIALLAWYFLRKKKPAPSNRPADMGANTNSSSVPPPMTVATPGNAPSMHKASSSWSTTAPPSRNAYNNGASFPNGFAPLPGSMTGRISTQQEVVGPGGYVPPPPEEVVATTRPPGGTGYYGSAPITEVATISFVGSQPPRAAPSPYEPSRNDTISPDMTTYSSTTWTDNVSQTNDAQRPPWIAGLSPDPERQQQYQQQQQQQQQQQSQQYQQHVEPVRSQPISPPSRITAISPPPVGPMSPPPPFAIDPPMFSGVGVASESEKAGRQVPMTAPADKKARPSGAGAPLR